MSNDNLNDPAMADILRRLRALETAASVGFSSITRGALRVTSPEGLLVEGSERVTGTLDVEGTENITGTLNVDGPLNVAGLATLLNSLVLAGGGKIDIGNVVLQGGVISGDTVQINGATVIILQGETQLLGSLLVSAAAQVQSLTVQNNASVGGAVSVGGGITNAGMPQKLGATPNVYIDGAGKFWRTN